jgi:hypothetical protein
VCCFGLESVADSRIIGRRTVELMLVAMLIASRLQTGRFDRTERVLCCGCPRSGDCARQNLSKIETLELAVQGGCPW